MVIIDTSIIYKWLIDEEPVSLQKSANHLLARVLSQKEVVAAPSLLNYELANVLATKTKFTDDEVLQLWLSFIKLPLQIVTLPASSITDAIELARLKKVSVYDASYAILAQEKKCQLITADERFVKQVHLPFIRFLGDL